MKRFLNRMLIFAAFAVVIDLAFGAIFPFLREKAKGGRTREEYFIAEECEAEVLVFGSSRAQHHYVPSVIEESLGLSCYNCGEDEMGSLFAYARYRMLSDRYTPKLIIYDVAPSFDYFADEDNTKYLGNLKPYSYKDGVLKIIMHFADMDTRLLLNSQMYRNNSQILSYLINFISDRYYSDNGYQALHGKMTTEKIDSRIVSEDTELELDSEKICILEEMIQDCQTRNIPFVFVVSPVYGGQSRKYTMQRLQPAIDLAAKYGVPFLDFSDEDEVAFNCGYFQDETHMNDSGARYFSKILVDAMINSDIILLEAQ